ncbi:hypothetical protein BJF78_21765 [Pseudonocardia sp. CNS-139]|nr:hypothetical protein BJF78_21765 [Pseudonocardia sp. CNS-139]
MPEQVGVAVGGLQPVVPERDGGQAEALLGREHDPRDAHHAEVAPQHAERAGPGERRHGVPGVAHLGRAGGRAGPGHSAHRSTCAGIAARTAQVCRRTVAGALRSAA